MTKPSSMNPSSERQLTAKIIIAVLLAVAVFMLFQVNKKNIKANRKMAKYIRAEQTFKQNLAHLEKSKLAFTKYVADISTKGQEEPDLEKMKSGVMNDLLNAVKSNELKVDSYNSQVHKDGDQGVVDAPPGGVVFRCQLTVHGTFIQVLRFFDYIRQNTPHIRIKDYSMRQHMGSKVRLALNAEVIGVEMDF